MTPHLTAEQVQLFRHNGFLKLPTQLPDPWTAELKSTIWHDIRSEIEPLQRDAEGRVVRISNLWDRQEIFREVLGSKIVLDYLKPVLGQNIELVKNRHNHATLRLASETAYGLHRDIYQWSRTIVTIIFFLEQTTVDNGCTHLIPGSQLLPGVDKNLVGDDPGLRKSGVLEQAMPVPMPAGGMLMLDSMVIHSAGINTTTSTRISMTVGYHSVDELIRDPNPQRVLVSGEHAYRGNDP